MMLCSRSSQRGSSRSPFQCNLIMLLCMFAVFGVYSRMLRSSMSSLRLKGCGCLYVGLCSVSWLSTSRFVHLQSLFSGIILEFAYNLRIEDHFGVRLESLDHFGDHFGVCRYAMGYLRGIRIYVVFS